MYFIRMECVFMISKAKIQDKILDIVDPYDYLRNPHKYSYGYNAIVDQGTVYPIRGKNDTRPGFYPGPVISKFVEPDDSEKADYSAENIIDFDNVDSIKEVMRIQNKLKNAERSILTSTDNIFAPRIDPNDYPEMVGLKEAVTAKNIDLDKYEQRFGMNFNNDKRLFNKNSITMGKLKTMFEALDMKATLVIEDREEGIPNPMGKKIIVDLTGSNNNNNGEE